MEVWIWVLRIERFYSIDVDGHLDVITYYDFNS